MTVMLMKGEAQISHVEKEGESRVCARTRRGLIHGHSVLELEQEHPRLRPQLRGLEGAAQGHCSR